MTVPALTTVFSSDALGGSELFNLEFLRTAHGRGVAIYALVPGEGQLATELEPLAQRIEVLPIPDGLTAMSRFNPGIEPKALPGRVRALATYLPRLRRLIARLPGPVCSLGFRSQLAVAAILPPHRRGIWVVHEVVPRGVPAQLWRAASLRASRIVAYSRVAATQPALCDRGAVVRAVRFDLSGFASIPEISGVGRLGLVGDLVDLKNHLLAIELTKRLRDQGARVELTLVGRDVSKNVRRAGRYAERVRQLVAATPGVELVSSSPEAMPQMMARFDLLLHFSSVPESFGRVCVEAMAGGRPVVAFDHGAVSELIDHGRTGLLCEPGSAEAAREAVQHLLHEPQRCVEMGRLARVLALDRFSVRPDRQDTVGDALADFATESQ